MDRGRERTAGGDPGKMVGAPRLRVPDGETPQRPTDSSPCTGPTTDHERVRIEARPREGHRQRTALASDPRSLDRTDRLIEGDFPRLRSLGVRRGQVPALRRARVGRSTRLGRLPVPSCWVHSVNLRPGSCLRNARTPGPRCGVARRLVGPGGSAGATRGPETRGSPGDPSAP